MGKKRMGRPPLGRKSRKVFVGIRVSPEELAGWKRRAKAEGMSLSAWLVAPRRAKEGEKGG